MNYHMNKAQVRSRRRIEPREQRRSSHIQDDAVDHEVLLDAESFPSDIICDPGLIDVSSDKLDCSDPHLAFYKRRNEQERIVNNGERSKGKSRRLIERRQEEKLLAEELADIFFEYNVYKKPNRRRYNRGS